MLFLSPGKSIDLKPILRLGAILFSFFKFFIRKLTFDFLVNLYEKDKLVSVPPGFFL